MPPKTPWRRDVGSEYRLRVLIANSPGAYREAISAAIAMLRPGVEVSTTSPEDLDRAIPKLEPHLIVCSRITRAVENGGSWVELYPEGASHATVGLNGRRYALPDMNLADLLAIIDGLESPGSARNGVHREPPGESWAYADWVRQRLQIS